MITQRFLNRLVLPPASQAIIKSVTQLKQLDYNTEYLELYHTICTHSSTVAKNVVASIVTSGFKAGTDYGSKGPGVYLSSHSAYGLRWVGPNPGMLICYVKTEEPNKIK